MNPRQEKSVLELRGLTVKFPRIDGTWDKVVRAVDLNIDQGEVVGLVGESGSGKTMVGLSLLDLVPQQEFVLSTRSGSMVMKLPTIVRSKREHCVGEKSLWCFRIQ